MTFYKDDTKNDRLKTKQIQIKYNKASQHTYLSACDASFLFRKRFHILNTDYHIKSKQYLYMKTINLNYLSDRAKKPDRKAAPFVHITFYADMYAVFLDDRLCEGSPMLVLFLSEPLLLFSHKIRVSLTKTYYSTSSLINDIKKIIYSFFLLKVKNQICIIGIPQLSGYNNYD